MSPARKEPDINTYSGRFAKRLRELREQKNKTVAEILEVIPIKQATYYSWESGSRQPDLDMIFELSKLFGVSPRSMLPVK